VLRGLTRELTHTVAVAARRETAARFSFDIHVISWWLSLLYAEFRLSPNCTGGRRRWPPHLQQSEATNIADFR